MDGRNDSRGHYIPTEIFKGRLLGLDFGGRTVGVAVSDELGFSAGRLETVRRKKPDKLRTTLSRISDLVSVNDASGVVLGWPVNIDGSQGERCTKTLEFAGKLKLRISVPIIFWDERLTTVEAKELMQELGIQRSLWDSIVDEVAAKVILQDFLDHAHSAGWYGTN